MLRSKHFMVHMYLCASYRVMRFSLCVRKRIRVYVFVQAFVAFVPLLTSCYTLVSQ